MVDDNTPAAATNTRPVQQESKLSRRRILLGAAVSGLTLLGGGFSNPTEAAAKKKKPTTTKKKVTPKPTTTVAASGAPTGPTFADTQELVVTWTYTASGGGRIHNPYVAVWVEDSSGAPVAIVHLEYQLDRKGGKWLKDIKRWFRVDESLVAAGMQTSAETTTQATRLPGTYSAVWNGKNAQGALVPHGTYTVWIEAAREKGPYQFTKETITIGAEPAKKTFAPATDLTAASMELRTKK